MRWLETTTLLGDRVVDWLTALGIAAALLLALLVLKRLAVRRLGRLAERTATQLDDFAIDLARRTRTLLVSVPALYLGSLYLDLPAAAARVLEGTAALAVFLQVALWASVGIDFWMARHQRRRLELEQDATSAALLGVLRFVATVVLWSVILLLALDNLGVDVTTLVAGLGIGGVAVALALQNVLGDLLASLSIVFDKPFVIGDTISVDDLTGTVESIGMKTTRLRSASGEQLVLANGELLKSRIRNWKRMSERRVVLAFGVPYQTPAEAIERIPGMVRGLVEGQDLTRFERAHFKTFGPSSLDFEAVYWILTPDYNAFMDRQQAINLGLLRAFEAAGIGFAYPTQTVILAGGNLGRDSA
ncbi:MAG TPA: mechanosensitive ion channel family protein [Thermoanaerobaculia bacterium]|jgi:small-conductance mechanosensitive channel|nr:mechanosensitive ion channel family protein [Thermoanaerobaculia bacterium]